MIQVDTSISFESEQISHQFTSSQNRVVLFGASGAGKSVLLRMIAGFFNPDRGRINVRSRTLFDSSAGIDLPVHQRRIGYLPQEYTLFPNLNVIDNILYGIRVQKVALDNTWFDHLVSRLEIADLLQRDPTSLSGGQQQRVALARILIIRPDILLLDEPFSALDSTISETLRDMVIDLVDELNIMTLLVTHDLDEAFVFAKELVLVHRGSVIESGERDQLYRRPRFVESARLLGFSNIFPIVTTASNKAELKSGDKIDYLPGFPEDCPFLCVRPEHIMILREESAAGRAEPHNQMNGSVRHIYHHGRYVKVTMESDSGLMLGISIPVHVHERLALKPEDPLQVFLKKDAVVLCDSIYGNRL